MKYRLEPVRLIVWAEQWNSCTRPCRYEPRAVISCLTSVARCTGRD